VKIEKHNIQRSDIRRQFLSLCPDRQILDGVILPSILQELELSSSVTGVHWPAEGVLPGREWRSVLWASNEVDGNKIIARLESMA
jgi:hypothetical protein